MAEKEQKMITAKEYAELHSVHYTTVMNWLRQDLLPGATKEDLPFGGYFYRIPINTPIPALKPGPKTMMERLEKIGAEIAGDPQSGFGEFYVLDRAQDSNDLKMVFRRTAGEEVTVTLIRRAGQTDEAIRKDIKRQLSIEPTKKASRSGSKSREKA